MFQTGEEDDVDAQVAAMMAELAVKDSGPPTATAAASQAVPREASAMPDLPAVPTDPPSASTQIDHTSLPPVFSALLDRNATGPDAPVPIPRSTTPAGPPPLTAPKSSARAEFTFNL